jgi:hypothetical protein
MGIKEKQALYDMLFMKQMNSLRTQRGSGKSMSSNLIACHVYAFRAGNYILAAIDENLDGISTIYDA